MLAKIKALLHRSPGQKAKSIASHIDEEKGEVNAFLYRNQKVFYRDSQFNWYLVDEAELRIEFTTQGWLTAEEFENDLARGVSPLEATQQSIKFILADGSKMMIESLARLLALCNQLIAAGKRVSLDFSLCAATLTYLDRVGFFDHLHEKVEVLPKRPSASRASKYGGKNDGVVELLKIESSCPNQEIPKRLGNSFVQCAGDNISLVGAHTVLTELFSNVEEHSGSDIGGFAGLQFYKKTRHIQAVISDSGIGIVGTLQPALSTRYPHVLRKIAASKLDPGVALLREVFSTGGLSQSTGDGRGLGLKRSGDFACQFKAAISVRQETFELKVFHEPDRSIRFSHRLNLAKIRGTHICFDLKLD